MTLASEIAAFFSTPLNGMDFDVTSPKSMHSAEVNSVVFLSRPNDEVILRFNKLAPLLCITTEKLAEHLTCTVLISDNPRLSFAKMLNAFFLENEQAVISQHAFVDQKAIIGDNVSIGPGSHIDAGVTIGNESKIGSNVVIKGDVKIGNHCLVKSNSTIGEPGFGIVRDEQGPSVSFPHLGRVEIGNYVEIGANCTVARAALDATILEDYVKTDDHVHIAHNCHIGSGTFIAAGAILSGSIQIGSDVWISPNATLIDQSRVGDRAFIGLGSVVTKSVKAEARVFGVPAKPIKSPRR